MWLGSSVGCGLWHRLAAMALIQPIAQDLPYAAGATRKKKRKRKKKKKQLSQAIVSQRPSVFMQEASYLGRGKKAFKLG